MGRSSGRIALLAMVALIGASTIASRANRENDVGPPSAAVMPSDNAGAYAFELVPVSRAIDSVRVISALAEINLGSAENMAKVLAIDSFAEPASMRLTMPTADAFKRLGLERTWRPSASTADTLTSHRGLVLRV